MTYFAFDLVAHTLIATTSLAFISKIDLDSIYNLNQKSAMSENQLKICAAIASGFNNISDVFAEMTDLTPDEKYTSLSVIHESLETWKTQHPGLDLKHCEIQCKNSTYQPEAYRLDSIDSPNRRFNWSSRIQRKED